jgi:YVTN family beta-propeller protein
MLFFCNAHTPFCKTSIQNKQVIQKMIRTKVIFVASVLLTTAFSGQALADAIATDTWSQFSFTDSGTLATGCAPNDPGGQFCIPSSGTPSVFLGAPAWTFVAPSGGALFQVVDAFTSGERFEVFDNLISLGFTSAPGTGLDCGDDPVVCLGIAGISSGGFALGAGAHSITIVPSDSPDGLGSAFAIANTAAVPEPATFALVGIALCGAALVRRRKQVARHVIQRGAAMLVLVMAVAAPAEAQTTRFAGPTNSQPLALNADGSFLVVENPDNNTASFFDVRNDRNRKVAEVPVQSEPNGAAFSPNGRKAYIANTVSGTVSVIKVNIAGGAIGAAKTHIPVGTEPWGLCMSPNGTRLFVMNARSNSVSVINTATDTVIATVTVDTEPRGCAVTNDGDADDTDEALYVTHFMSFLRPGKVDGQDDAKAGRVTILNAGTNAFVTSVVLNPLADSGFLAAGDALARIAPGANFTFPTGAYPNGLQNVAVKGAWAFVPNTGASPNGPFRFNVNTQSLLSVINRTNFSDAGQTINMHRAVSEQASEPKLFITQPWAMAFENSSNDGFVISAASDIMVKVRVDPASGAPTVLSDPLDPTRVLQIKVGKNPRGIVVNANDTRAYVMNYVSRDVSVIDLTPAREIVTTTLPSASLPSPGSQEDKIHIGKELYHTSVGAFDGPAGNGRMSNSGWGACAACHPLGLSDQVVWIFPDGPRRTISQHTDFDQTDITRSVQRVLNWSAVREEEEDFELNIRAVSGGQGLIVLADGVTPDPAVQNLAPNASGGRNQVKVRGVNAWDAIKSYVQFGIRTPISPVSKTDPDVVSGRALFISANCQQCHGGAQWTSGRLRFTPPPAANQIVNGQLIAELRGVGTFDPAAFNEVKNTGAPAIGSDGFVPASLLSVFSVPADTLLHNGSAQSLDQVMTNVTHRSAGTSGVDTLTNAADRAKIVKFLLSIDASTVPIPLP